MKNTGIIIKKELYRVFGDKKMIFSLFLLPALIVIVMYALMGQLISGMSSDITEHISNVYIVNAPEKFRECAASTGYDTTADIKWIDEEQYTDMKEDMDAEILDGVTDLCVYFGEDFEDEVAAYKDGAGIPSVKVYYNSTENYSSQAYSVFSSTVSAAYENVLLTERFGNTDVLTVFSEDAEVICKEEKLNTEFISMLLPYMIVLMLFSGVMSVGVDSLAGEKERGTLASMLISPAKRSEIAAGKLISLAVLSGLSSLVYAVSMVIAMSVMAGSDDEIASMGFGAASFGFVQIVELIALMLALVYVYVGVVGLLSTIAKDTKVASTYVSPVYIVVIMCGMLTMFSSGKEVPTGRYAIPVYGVAMAIKDICGNELTAVNFAMAFIPEVLIGVILTFMVKKAFDSEKLMFNA